MLLLFYKNFLLWIVMYLKNVDRLLWILMNEMRLIEMPEDSRMMKRCCLPKSSYLKRIISIVAPWLSHQQWKPSRLVHYDEFHTVYLHFFQSIWPNFSIAFHSRIIHLSTNEQLIDWTTFQLIKFDQFIWQEHSHSLWNLVHDNVCSVTDQLFL